MYTPMYTVNPPTPPSPRWSRHGRACLLRCGQASSRWCRRAAEPRRAPGHCCGPPVPAGRRNCGRFGPPRLDSCAPVSIRPFLASGRLQTRGGGVFLNRFSNPIPSTVSVSQGSTTRRAILRTRSAFGSPHLIVHSFLTPLRKFSHGKVFEFVRPRGGCNLRRIVCWIDLNPDACRAHSV